MINKVDGNNGTLAFRMHDQLYVVIRREGSVLGLPRDDQLTARGNICLEEELACPTYV